MLAGVARSIRSSRLPEGETDLTLGYARAFQEIGETLKSEGASREDVIDITTFHTDVTTQCRPSSPSRTATSSRRFLHGPRSRF
jgi:enamine deaminase RidA (YjgF/YER057c/UK114 family)